MTSVDWNCHHSATLNVVCVCCKTRYAPLLMHIQSSCHSRSRGIIVDLWFCIWQLEEKIKLDSNLDWAKRTGAVMHVCVRMCPFLYCLLYILIHTYVLTHACSRIRAFNRDRCIFYTLGHARAVVREIDGA